MQAFSPAPKSNEKYFASASPRKKKFQAQLTSPAVEAYEMKKVLFCVLVFCILSPHNGNEF